MGFINGHLGPLQVAIQRVIYRYYQFNVVINKDEEALGSFRIIPNGLGNFLNEAYELLALTSYLCIRVELRVTHNTLPDFAHTFQVVM